MDVCNGVFGYFENIIVIINTDVIIIINLNIIVIICNIKFCIITFIVMLITFSCDIYCDETCYMDNRDCCI